ncbi:cysteine rich repeat-containing protein [Telmatobacter sp. DSM 110680]|uniref:Cysteine rich repeat-containing protein n=1 Tax=Telmatobacter sp. DSM 110680 TaxID=3036704 RepID=A0AAU7DL83_9BACT
MRRLILVVIVCAVAAQSGMAQDQLAAIRAACAADAQKLCADVPSGGGRIIACLKEHKDSLSDKCKKAAGLPVGPSNSSAPSASSAAAASETPALVVPTASPSAAGPVATPAARSSHSAGAVTKAAAATDSASGSYLRMKQVQIIAPVVDPKLGNGKDPVNLPVLDLLIPSTWDFKSNVEFNTKSGCISDLFSVAWEAKSADGSIDVQGAPDLSWQFADDPAALHNLTDPSRRQINAQGKPCPVWKPMKAEEYFRQKVFTFFPNGSTVVSVEPFPELNQMARRQLGLPPDDGGNAGDSRTEAIRARVEFQKDGKEMEDWVALVVLTRTFRQGRGAFYDCHAIDVIGLSAPKGKLDANDKLFKVMISSLRPEAKWQAYSNGVLAWRYQVEAKKEAQIDAIIANFQNQVAQTLSEVTANQQRGSLNAAFGADQGIRGVQTFRNPTTGATMELSNQYNHAWLNGSNEYIMSDDPNFNPNGQLSGDWNQLQAVRPQP